MKDWKLSYESLHDAVVILLPLKRENTKGNDKHFFRVSHVTVSQLSGDSAPAALVKSFICLYL